MNACRLSFLFLLPLLSLAEIHAQPPNAQHIVVVGEVAKTTLQKKLWFNANVVSDNTAVLSSESAGRVLKIAEVGDRFVARETVASLDASLLTRDLKALMADVASKEARTAFLERETARLQELVEKNNASISKLEEVQSDYSSTVSMKEAAEERVAQTREIIRRMTILAPFDGIVTARMADFGEWVKEGASLVEIVDLKNKEIQAWLPFWILPFVSKGETLTVAWRGQELDATTRAIIPVGAKKTRLFEMRLSYGDAPIHVGELVQVGVPVAAGKEVLVVPEDALVIRSNGISVFVVNDDMTVRQTKVKPGLADGDGGIEVSGNLQAREKVVVRGGERLRRGMKVKIKN